MDPEDLSPTDLVELERLADEACRRSLLEAELVTLCDLAKRADRSEAILLRLMKAGTVAGRLNLNAARRLTAPFAARHHDRAEARLARVADKESQGGSGGGTPLLREGPCVRDVRPAALPGRSPGGAARFSPHKVIAWLLSASSTESFWDWLYPSTRPTIHERRLQRILIEGHKFNRVVETLRVAEEIELVRGKAADRSSRSQVLAGLQMVRERIIVALRIDRILRENPHVVGSNVPGLQSTLVGAAEFEVPEYVTAAGGAVREAAIYVRDVQEALRELDSALGVPARKER